MRRLTAEWEPSYDLGSDADVHAHITVLGPFAAVDELPRLEAALVEVLARVEPFDFRLDEVAAFSGEVVILKPDPAAPFADLTAQLFERFPAHPPYGGKFAEVIPHLTVGPIWSAGMERSLRAAAESAIPIEATATEVRLIRNDDRSFRTVARYPLGSA